MTNNFNQRIANHKLQQLFWECTLRCNLNCKHCGSDCRISNAITDMPFADFIPVLESVAQNVPDTKKVIITLSGGEPLMRNDLAICGKEIRQLGFPWAMVSNGMLLTKEKLEELIDAGLRAITISIDGFEDAHNWLRGNIVSFENAVSAIKNLVQSPKQISWDVITCVNQKNYKKLLFFKDFLYMIGVRSWRLFTIFPSGRAIDNPELFLSSLQFENLMHFIVRIKQEGKMKINYSCEGYLGNFENRVRYYPFFCQSGVNIATILADGSISGCMSIRDNKFIQGSIYNSDFYEVWNNKFKIFRDKTWAKTGMCKDCNAYEDCLGGSMHLRNKNSNLSICRLDYLNKNNLPSPPNLY
ncbi:MAG: TIGR04133 family radical SAM/SPASM protein [Bacteroidota bacterium]